MKVLLVTIGKWKRSQEQALFDHYAKRWRWSLEVKELTGYPKLLPKQRQAEETTLLLTTARDWGAQLLLTLDETGKPLSSERLAQTFQNWQDQGIRQIACLIGGDVGLDKEQCKQTDLQLSFGAMTWPHLLVRVLLAEQLYRVQTILDGHPYHRG